MIGVIPAAGKASRMGEFGSELPKALIEIEGLTLLERSIGSLKQLGVDYIVVVVGHLGEKISEFISGHDFGIEVRTVTQERPLGLAHAIATAASEIESDFVVLCPDNIFTDETDFTIARDSFAKHDAAFMLLATITPSKQRDRKAYHTSAHRNRGENLYDYRAQNSNTSGLPINSTGCCFFKHEALNFLPTFDESEQEHIFRDYLETIVEARESLLYLVRGMRYDFSELADIDRYVQLKRILRQTQGRGVSAILINELGQVLLQQRDDNPAIRYPGHWSLFGGTIEDGESAAEAVARACAGNGPTLMECKTYRIVGHHEGDPGTEYRTKEEVDSWRKQCPINTLRSRVLAEGLVDASELDRIEQETAKWVEDAVEYSRKCPAPLASTVGCHVFSESV